MSGLTSIIINLNFCLTFVLYNDLFYVCYNFVLFRIIDVNARRPSLRTDLLLNRAKSAAAGLSSPAFYQVIYLNFFLLQLVKVQFFRLRQRQYMFQTLVIQNRMQTTSIV